MAKIITKPFFILLLFTLAAYGQQTSVAVLPSDGSAIGNDELEALTDKMREAALKALPTNAFVLLKQDVVIKRLGGAENYIKECSQSSCIVDLGKKAQVDYVAQASVGKLGDKIRLSPNKYSVRLSHECYENIGFDVGINKGKREVFDMASNSYLGNWWTDDSALMMSYDENYDESFNERWFSNYDDRYECDLIITRNTKDFEKGKVQSVVCLLA